MLQKTKLEVFALLGTSLSLPQIQSRITNFQIFSTKNLDFWKAVSEIRLSPNSARWLELEIKLLEVMQVFLVV